MTIGQGSAEQNVFEATAFRHVDKLYQSIFYLFKKLLCYKILFPEGVKSAHYLSRHPPKIVWHKTCIS